MNLQNDKRYLEKKLKEAEETAEHTEMSRSKGEPAQTGRSGLIAENDSEVSAHLADQFSRGAAARRPERDGNDDRHSK